MGFGLSALRRVALYAAISPRRRRAHLVAAFLTLTGECQCMLGEGVPPPVG